MPNKAVQAAGEAMPKTTMPHMTEAFARERIGILGHEILQLLDAVPGSCLVSISPFSRTETKGKVSIGFEVNGEFFEQPAPEHPWAATRRLMRELSISLANCNGGSWAAHVLPAASDKDELQLRRLPQDGDGMPEIALDRVERLSWELSEALNDYAGATFQAMVLPSSIGGYTVMFTKISAWDGRASR